MLKRLHLRNFTVFKDAEFEFGKGLNVLVGTNGTGKTHVLKAGYTLSLVASLAPALDAVSKYPKDPRINFFEASWAFSSIRHFNNVFQCETADSLVRRPKGARKMPHAEVMAAFEPQQVLLLSISSNVKSDEIVVQQTPSIGFRTFTPVFIPAKEVLTMGWLLAVHDRLELQVDETFPSLLRLLAGPPMKQPEPFTIVEKLRKLIGGKVEEESGRFYLIGTTIQPRLEMNMVAEGMRKFATLYKLLANGTLTPETTLFWDEPEANLNPALLKEMAAVLTELAHAGFQIILATHSLFLLKELHILSQREKTAVKYFGLFAGPGGDTQVETKDDFVQLAHVAALDAELAQTYDFEDALDQDYASDN